MNLELKGAQPPPIDPRTKWAPNGDAPLGWCMHGRPIEVICPNCDDDYSHLVGHPGRPW